MIKQKKLTYGKLAIYIIALFAIWSIQRLYFRPVFINQLDGLFFELVDSGSKIIIWLFPALWMLRRFGGEMWLNLREMFVNKPSWQMVVISTIAIGVVAFLVGMLYGDGFSMRTDFEWRMLIAPVLVAGITEELVFRGVILNSLLPKMKTVFAVLIDAILFALIHYPIWIYVGFGLPTILINSAFSIFFSILLSFSFLKTKNILVPVGLHMFYNFLITIFVM